MRGRTWNGARALRVAGFAAAACMLCGASDAGAAENASAPAHGAASSGAAATTASPGASSVGAAAAASPGSPSVGAAATASPGASSVGAAAAASPGSPSVGAAGSPAPAIPASGAPVPAAGASPSSIAPLSIQPQSGTIREPAPRPVAAVRVQSRYAVKAKLFELFGGAEYLSRGDFYNSPGVRVGATYYLLESLGFEAQISHYWSSLDAEAERIKQTLGAIPDSHAPGWLALAGARYSIGYGKLMVGGVGGVIHFEPQAFAHAGVHDHEGDVGPSFDAGLGFLVFLTPKLFARIDAALVFEREERSGRTVSVWGTLPALSVGGTL